MTLALPSTEAPCEGLSLTRRYSHAPGRFLQRLSTWRGGFRVERWRMRRTDSCPGRPPGRRVRERVGGTLAGRPAGGEAYDRRPMTVDAAARKTPRLRHRARAASDARRWRPRSAWRRPDGACGRSSPGSAGATSCLACSAARTGRRRRPADGRARGAVARPTGSGRLEPGLCSIAIDPQRAMEEYLRDQLPVAARGRPAGVEPDVRLPGGGDAGAAGAADGRARSGSWPSRRGGRRVASRTTW